MGQRVIASIAVVALLIGCHKDTAAAPEDKSVAEKAGDAATRARKKAEELKKAEDQKTKETDTAGND